MKVVHWLLTVAVAWWFRQDGAATGCDHKCGKVTVPYPFGLEPQCARSQDFLLNCTNVEGSDLRLMLGNFTIRKILAGRSTMVVSLPEAYQCYDQNGKLAKERNPVVIDLSPYPRYKFSETLNNLTVLGCNTMAVVADREGTFGSGCISYCGKNVDFTNETTCSGRGCCQASIPKGFRTLNISISSLNRNVLASQLGHCERAFVVDNRSFHISKLTLPRFEDVGNTPGLVLEWMVESNTSCNMAKKNGSSYACGPYAACKDFGDVLGYRCTCKHGYRGNPYDRTQGCTDINECVEPEKYPCYGKCKNIPGSYECRCGLGKRGDARKRCKVSPLGIAIPVMAVSFFGIIVTASVRVTMRWRLRKINFRKNGGELMKNRKVPIFTESKLAKATNPKKLRSDGFGFVYKGTLEEQYGTVVVRDTVVVVKKPKDMDRSLLNKDFQHELEILMNISCKNVVKLKGICLETKIPSLVYEYIPNGSLFQLIHQNKSTISWEKRFKIAAEAALALNYMHSKIQSPIFHGNIKSANILLDQNNSVKISDFGTSVLISPKHRHIVATQKKDSLAYIDPEYLVTGMLTPQSDAYSFGVVLVELLTGKELFVTESEKSFNTIHCFISSVKGDTLSDVINFEGASEYEMERIRTVAKIAVKCLDQSGANRPAMSHVAQQLASINPSSTVEEENEEPEREVDAEELSSCLSCLGMDSTSSCI
ncbi:wall-associated receptor kinase 2 [Eucalyptus grandis]|uniref:wall-associated receptor kinase 2 n=1 Tax=Eucalyptus grandis TaxID=71139 RepID=UPI00192EA55D|nr:wall-associated receptor kinase 2 [Eucalyptus grandis]